MFGREFQVVGAVPRKARPENAVLWNGTDSSGTVEERKVRPHTHAVMRRLSIVLHWRGCQQYINEIQSFSLTIDSISAFGAWRKGAI